MRVEITDASLVPGRFIAFWCDCERHYKDPPIFDDEELLAALQEPCAGCKGAGGAIVAMGANGNLAVTCPACGGTGLRQIPGAKLMKGEGDD